MHLLDVNLTVITVHSGYDLARGHLSALGGAVEPQNNVISSSGPCVRSAAVTVATSAGICCIVSASNWRSTFNFHYNARLLDGPYYVAIYAGPCTISRCGHQQQYQGIYCSTFRGLTISS